MAALLGPEAPGLSATTVVRLKQVWEEDFKVWNQRSLEGKRYVYLWVDGIHCNVRLEDGRPCILVVIGATPEGTKELVAIQDGERESDASWTEVLVDVNNRPKCTSRFRLIAHHFRADSSARISRPA